MSAPTRKTIPLWQRLDATGNVRAQVAGVQARLKPGEDAAAKSAAWLVAARSLGSLAPRPGDRCRGTDGVERLCVSAGPPSEAGEYECVLERLEG